MAKEIDFPPVWLAGFAAAGGLLGLIYPVPTPVNDVLGPVLVVLGILLMLVALGQMVLARTTFIPRRDPAALVRTGVFRFSRNPIYLADVLVLAGLLIAWDALIALPLVPVFMSVVSRRFIREEEARLSDHFGEDFDDYRQATRRWL
ncbi:MAG: isoprenylcysteine carboxylmethyltransferase family protein [Paracoccaceae bacterium]